MRGMHTCILQVVQQLHLIQLALVLLSLRLHQGDHRIPSHLSDPEEEGMDTKCSKEKYGEGM